MGLPKIIITFRTLAAAIFRRSNKGIVALIVRGSEHNGSISFANETEIPAGWCDECRDYIKRAFIGYITPPRRVIVYMIDREKGKIDDALKYFATQRFDYLAGPSDITHAEATTIAGWVKSKRLKHHKGKVVLPKVAADHEGIINFTAEDIEVVVKPPTDENPQGEVRTYKTAEYCSRIAGLIAGTPMKISCTYAPLPEVLDIKRKEEEELDAAVDKGEFILIHDGEKVKVGRAVNSLVTTTQDKGESFKSIKVVETIDMIDQDIRTTLRDSYIGKYANSYDNKCLVLVAIGGYLEELESDEVGILEKGTSQICIDVEAHRLYLKKRGIDTEKMSEQEIRTANTGKQLMLGGRIVPLEAIEDVALGFLI